MDFSTITIVAAIIFISTLTRSTLGFGDGLLGMPLLTIVVGIEAATPLIAFVATTIAVTILRSNWHQVDIRIAWRLIIGSLAGIPVGLFLLTNIPDTIVKSILGMVLVLFGLYNLYTPKLPELNDERFAFMFGFVAGILGGAYNTNGPPVVIYGSIRRWPPILFRATLQTYFFPTGFMILLGHGFAGLWTRDVVLLYAYVLPIVFLAIWMGGTLNKHIATEQFGRIVYGLLVVIGIVIIVSG
ncbi:MAG: sulfite exporter TauE/SafE family protein [Chloroflexi bacterium]|nr:sulfite exporter TauE/SafE family protein [Chloroflexota bacterium]